MCALKGVPIPSLRITVSFYIHIGTEVEHLVHALCDEVFGSPAYRNTIDPHIYEKPGRYRVLVKVVDIFGNDTSQAFEVRVK
jgi:hypothetical protein